MLPTKTKLIISISYHTYEAIKEKMGKKDRAMLHTGYYSKSQVQDVLSEEVDQLYGYRVQQMLSARAKKKSADDYDQTDDA